MTASRTVKNYGESVSGEKITLAVEVAGYGDYCMPYSAVMSSESDGGYPDHEIAGWSGCVGDDSWSDMWNVWLEIQGFGPLTLTHHHPPTKD